MQLGSGRAERKEMQHPGVTQPTWTRTTWTHRPAHHPLLRFSFSPLTSLYLAIFTRTTTIPRMPAPITIIPLGTSSAVPNATRNHSSLAIILPSSDTLLFDTGEATQHQIQRFKPVKHGNISKIFITHMHGDHIFGLCPLLASLCNGAGGTTDDTPDPRLLETTNATPLSLETLTSITPDIHIYGPSGIREYVRSTLKLTYTHLDKFITITELLFPDDPVSSTTDPLHLYEKEVPGRNLYQDPEGFWRNIHTTSEYTISAGMIRHSVPSIGYVLTETPLPGKIPAEYRTQLLAHKPWFEKTYNIKNPMMLLSALQGTPTGTQSKTPPTKYPTSLLSEEGIHLPNNITLPKPSPRPGRKITVLGDTHDPSPIIPLANFSTVLIHEATNAHIPIHDEPSHTKTTAQKENYPDVQARTISRGHSTPEMAALFARKIHLGGKGTPELGTLILNHFSARYKDDLADGPEGQAMMVMRAIRKCAENTWADGREGVSGLDDLLKPEGGMGGGEDGKDGEGIPGVRGRVICARDGVEIAIGFQG